MQLAEVFAEAWKPGPVKHPVLAFAIDKTTPSVIENLLLRTVEVLEIMHRARLALGQDPIYNSARGRDRKPLDPVLRLAVDVRHERVAHRVKLGIGNQPAWTQVVKDFGTVWPFMTTVLDRVQALLIEIRSTGYFEGVAPQPHAKEYVPFTPADVKDLLRASESLPAVQKRGGLTSA